MIRRPALIGLTLGGVAGVAIGVRYVRRSRPPALPEPLPAWPPLVLDDVPADPVVPDDDADVVVAPGPDPQPERPAPAPTEAPAPVDDPSSSAFRVAAASTTVVLDAIEASGGTCPPSHPVKGKLSSGIFHVPGLLNYERTRADRCYVDAAAAERDGLRVARR